jgi:hypothetical protein
MNLLQASLARLHKTVVPKQFFEGYYKLHQKLRIPKSSKINFTNLTSVRQVLTH